MDKVDLFDQPKDKIPNIFLEVERIKDEAKVNESLLHLKETPGWQNTSDPQRKMITTSIDLSRQAFLTTDEASVAAIGRKVDARGIPQIYPENELPNMKRLFSKSEVSHIGYGFDPKKRRDRESQNFIATMFCLSATRSLELNSFSDQDPSEIDNEFFNGSFVKYPPPEDNFDSPELIVEQIKENGYPCVLLFPDGNGKLIGDKLEFPKNLIHSAIVMGPAKDGEVLCWDKVDYGQPFRIIKLSELLQQYCYKSEASPFILGVRKLRDLRVKNK